MNEIVLWLNSNPSIALVTAYACCGIAVLVGSSAAKHRRKGLS
ncbi:hypothetical protein [Pelagicoccus albus]|nr:hypothetical protein [Pelagicoccus albus]